MGRASVQSGLVLTTAEDTATDRGCAGVDVVQWAAAPCTVFVGCSEEELLREERSHGHALASQLPQWQAEGDARGLAGARTHAPAFGVNGSAHIARAEVGQTDST